MTKFCKDCKWQEHMGFFRQLGGFGRFAKCNHPKARWNAGVDYYLVNGYQSSDDKMYCSVMRKFECGPDAKLFEAKK